MFCITLRGGKPFYTVQISKQDVYQWCCAQCYMRRTLDNICPNEEFICHATADGLDFSVIFRFEVRVRIRVIFRFEDRVRIRVMFKFKLMSRVRFRREPQSLGRRYLVPSMMQAKK